MLWQGGFGKVRVQLPTCPSSAKPLAAHFTWSLGPQEGSPLAEIPEIPICDSYASCFCRLSRSGIVPSNRRRLHNKQLVQVTAASRDGICKSALLIRSSPLVLFGISDC